MVADNFLSVELVDHASVRLRQMPEDMRRRLRVAIVRDGQKLLARVRAKLSGQVLKMRSGRLLRSIKAQMREGSDYIYGRVFSEGVAYAGIHEHGGQTRPHLIMPRNVQALHFMVGGREIFAKVVHHPGSKIPQRSYLRSSLAELREEIIADIHEAGRPRWS